GRNSKVARDFLVGETVRNQIENSALARAERILERGSGTGVGAGLIPSSPSRSQAVEVRLEITPLLHPFRMIFKGREQRPDLSTLIDNHLLNPRLRRGVEHVAELAHGLHRLTRS